MSSQNYAIDSEWMTERLWQRMILSVDEDEMLWSWANEALKAESSLWTIGLP
jgi:hypothetical protein